MEPLLIPTETGIFFDTETTGIPNWKVPSHMPEQPHMTQLAAVVMDIPQRRVIHSMDVIIQPDGWEIPPECVELNGITTEYAMDVGIPEHLALTMFIEMAKRNFLSEVNPGPFMPRYAFNTTFDNRIIRIALKRYMKNLSEPWKEGPYECQMIAARKHLGVKAIKLEDAYLSICGMQLEGAHNAWNDVQATIDLFYEMREDAFDDAADLFS